MKKVRPIKRKWLDWLLNTNAMGKEPEIIRNISTHFEKKKKKEKKKHNGRINTNKIKKKKEHNERLIKNGTMRYQNTFRTRGKRKMLL